MHKNPRYSDYAATRTPPRWPRTPGRRLWPVFCSGLGLVALSWAMFLGLLWGLGLISFNPATPTIPAWPCCP